MLEFASEPDPIFLAVLGDALDLTYDLLGDLGEEFGDGYPALAAVLSREQAQMIVDKLRRGLADPGLLRLNDYHWLVMHEALEMLCDNHNDGAYLPDGRVGPYTIDTISLGSIVDVYFPDADFLIGPALLQVEEDLPESYGFRKTAWKIAAGLPPSPEELELERIDPADSDMEPAEPRDRPWPTSGYVGPYPLREPETNT